jgi:hypothetical protein
MDFFALDWSSERGPSNGDKILSVTVTLRKPTIATQLGRKKNPTALK